MSFTVTLRPNSTDFAPGWTFGGGATTVHGAMSDDVTTTYAMAPNFNAVAQIGFGTMTMPAGARIVSVGLRLSVVGTSAASEWFQAAIWYSGASKIRYFTSMSDAPASTAPHVFGANGGWIAKLTPDGGQWTLAEVNRIKLRFSGAGTVVHFLEAFIDVVYNEQPVVSAVTPTGTITTAQPTIGWTYCADVATEILTADGFKCYEDVSAGDLVLTLNPATGLSEWQPVTCVSVFPGPHRMIRMEGASHSSLTTPDHRWLVEHGTQHRRGRSLSWDTRVFRATSDLSFTDRIPCAAPCADLPTEPKWADELVELVAWFYTEGCVHSSGIVDIVQSHAVNGPHVARIRRCLLGLFGPASKAMNRGRANKVPLWREDQRDPRMTRFRLNKAAGAALLAIAPNKAVTADFIRSLTAAQVSLFIETSIDADGSRSFGGRGKRPRREVSQKDPRRLDALHMACTLAGIRANLHQHGQDYWTLQLLRGAYIRPRLAASHPMAGRPGRFAITDESHAGPVWCPTTPNGTWLARRQGTVYWTGNTDPENDAEDRWLVRVYDDPLPSGFNPQTTHGTRADSNLAYVGAAGATSWPLPKALPVGVYDVFVMASDVGSNGRWSQWASAKFTVAGSPPAPPILVGVNPNAALGRNEITVEQTDNLLTLADYGGEELTGGYLRWKSISGISSGPTVVAGTGNGGSNGIQVTVSSATAIWRTPIGKQGYLVRASQQYSWSGLVKNSAAAGTAHLDAEWYDSAGAVIGSPSAGTTVTLSTSLQASTGTATSPSNAVYGLLRWNGAGLTAAQVLSTDEHMIRRGASVSPVYRGSLDSGNLFDPQDSTWASTSLSGTSWAIVGTGSLAAVSSANAYDLFELQAAPGTVGGSHVLNLGTPIRLPVLGGQPNGNYQIQFQGRAASGANLLVDIYLQFLDDNSLAIGAPVFAGRVTLVGSTFVVCAGAVDAPTGASTVQPQLVLSGEANTTDRWAFDQFGLLQIPDNWFFTQPWKPATGTNTAALVEYSDDAGVTWAPVRYTETTVYDPTTRIGGIADYEVIPNTSRTYRARTLAVDYQIDPVAGAQLTSAPSSSAAVTLPVTGWWLTDPFSQTRISLPVSASVPLRSPQPEGEFAPLGRANKVIVSDVTKGDELTLSMLFRTGAAYKAFEAMRDTGHILYLQSDQTDSWYVRIGDSRDAELLNSAARLTANGIYTVTVRMIQVDRPA